MKDIEGDLFTVLSWQAYEKDKVVRFAFSTLQWLWAPFSPLVLSHFLQLLSEPRGQGLSQPVQQFWELHVVVPVVIGEEGSGLETKKTT